MRSVTIKGSEFQDISQVHAFLKEELSFPSYYGGNYSALYDVLTETDLETRIVIDLSGTAFRPVADSLERMIEVIQDAAEENDRIRLEVIR